MIGVTVSNMAWTSEQKKTYMAEYYQRRKEGWNEGRAPRDRAKYHKSDRAYMLKTRYGITIEDYDRLLESQGGCCAICGSTKSGHQGRYFHVDHDHQTGKVRGLLCQSCNIALGHLKDDLNLVMATAAYLVQNENLLVLQKEDSQ